MENSFQPQKSKTLLIGVAVLGIIVLIAIAAYGYSRSSSVIAGTDVTTLDTITNNKDTTVATISTTTHSTSQKYKDGSYTVLGSYNTPVGQEHITVTLDLKKDIVVSSTVVSGEEGNTSEEAGQTKLYQDKFIKGYKSYVVGKDISTIHLNTVSGSSLTPKGFNDAVTKIEAQAKV